MDLHTGSCFWPLRDGLGLVAPPLEHDIQCDVAIIGAGITGALLADALVSEGVSVVVLDRRDVGSGSTAASTALLQYEIDEPLHRLRPRIGPAAADRAFLLGVEAIDDLESLATSLGCPFERRPSLYFASDCEMIGELRRELDARRAIGLEVDWIAQDELRSVWGLASPAAIRSAVAAQTDPYRLCHELLRRTMRSGGAVHDRTTVTRIDERHDGATLTTDRKTRVRCAWVMHATGYESASQLPSGAVELQSTYSIATEPLLPSPGRWLDRCLMWEFADPYLYMRWVGDRLLIGGGDVPFRNARARDRLIARKVRALQARMGELMPDLHVEPSFAWAGTFGTTKDGLGFIGPLPGRERSLVALGFGGNGITYSAIAARMLVDKVLGRPNEDAHLFALDR